MKTFNAEWGWQSCFNLLLHPIDGVHIAKYWLWEYKLKHKYQLKCACVCVSVHMCMYIHFDDNAYCIYTGVFIIALWPVNQYAVCT